MSKRKKQVEIKLTPKQALRLAICLLEDIDSYALASWTNIVEDADGNIFKVQVIKEPQEGK